MAGLPSNPISVNQQKQYGDTKYLEKLRTGLTSTPMTGVPTPAPTAGRPRGPQQQQQAQPQQQVPQQAPQIPPEHMTMIQEMAQAMKTAQAFAQRAAAPDAGPWLKYYAAAADQRYQALAVKVKLETPFFQMQQGL